MTSTGGRAALTRRALRPGLSLLASLAIHLALVGGAVALGVKAVAPPAPPVIIVRLITPPPPPPSVEPPRVRRPARAPTSAPPKLLVPRRPRPAPGRQTPAPEMPRAVETLAEPAAPVKAPEPPPAAVSPEPRPLAPVPPPAPAAIAPAPAPPAREARRVARAARAPAAPPLPSGVSVVTDEQTRPASGSSTASGGRPAADVAAIPPGAVRLAAPRGGYQVTPSYPAAARRLGVQGTTILRVFVAADGRVGEVAVEASAGHPDLDRAAADAVRRWRFEPGRRGAEAIGMWVRLPVEFTLR